MDGLFPNDEKGWSKGSLVLIWNCLKQTVGSPFFARAGPWKRNLPCGAIKLSVYKMVDLLHGENTLDKLSKQDFQLLWYGGTNTQGNPGIYFKQIRVIICSGIK